MKSVLTELKETSNKGVMEDMTMLYQVRISVEIGIIKKNQMEILEFKSIIIETKNLLEGLNSKFQWLDGRIIKLEDRLFNTV